MGTGGDNLDTLHSPAPGSEVRQDRSYGVLEFVLGPGGYDWTFHTVMGEPFEDTGTGTCWRRAGVPCAAGAGRSVDARRTGAVVHHGDAAQKPRVCRRRAVHES